MTPDPKPPPSRTRGRPHQKPTHPAHLVALEPHAPALVFPVAAWSAFVTDVKNG
ncbi:DUF397 domain-containing protein [Streptomyces lunaelactis]|nr:DUF397 domain-containing protein [Streptomyces lunaelactis]NUL14632.1 DUF397 domain-containing protein [Streptomyces lunaelactis]NUL27446.1 DUF397 domain-containing protein [Streptomyces lunaelactis]